MQSPNLLLDEGCGSRYCCWFFMLLKPILLNVSIYSERPVKGVSHTENNSGTINTFSPYFSRGRGYIKKNEGTFENTDTLAKSDRFCWLDMWSFDGRISKSRWISVTLFYLGGFLRKRWTVSRIDRSFQLSVLFDGQSWNSYFIELNYLNWTSYPFIRSFLTPFRVIRFINTLHRLIHRIAVIV